MPKETSSKQAPSPEEYGGAQIVGAEKLADGIGIAIPSSEVFALQDALLAFLMDKHNSPHRSDGEKSTAVLRIDFAAARVTVHRGTWEPPYARRGPGAARLRRERRKSR